MNEKKIKIKASWIIAYDGHEHRYLKDGEIVYQGQDIIYVGKRYDKSVDETLNAVGKIISPGFVTTHAHPAYSPLDRSLLDDVSGDKVLYELMLPLQRSVPLEMRTILYEFGLMEMLRCGTTTAVDINFLDTAEKTVPLIKQYGNRVYLAPMTFSADLLMDPKGEVKYEWMETESMEILDHNIDFLKTHENTCDGLIRGMISIGQADTSTEKLLLKSQEYAKKYQMPVTIHTAQSGVEYQEMLKRYGKTSLSWLRDIGFLQDNVLLGHAFIISGSSHANWFMGEETAAGDLEIMAKSGCSVAHCPWVYMRDGAVLESFARYLEAGINMSIGTDTSPQNILRNMRLAAIGSKMADYNPKSTTAADVFNAATLGGAKALGRDDIGRLGVGAKADMVIFSGNSLGMAPLRDPVSNIVYNSDKDDVETVIVNGRTVIEKGQVLGGDESEICHRIQEMASEVWSNMPENDLAKRSVDELSPLKFKYWKN